MDTALSFEGLRVYQIARQLVKGIYLLQNEFPKGKPYALGDQVRKVAISITANLAVGNGRVGEGEDSFH